jgi:cytochrome c oxidase subunit 1
MYNDTMGKVFAIWVTVAFNFTFIPLFWVGINGMNRRVGDYPQAYESANKFASVSALLLGASFLLFVGNIAWSALAGPKAGSNPWNARTLEWQVSSPPSQHNFHSQPVIVGPPYDYGEPYVIFPDAQEPSEPDASGKEALV